MPRLAKKGGTPPSFLSVFNLYYKRFISLRLSKIFFLRCLQQFLGVGSAGGQQGGNYLAA